MSERETLVNPGQIIDPRSGDWVSLTSDKVRVVTVALVEHQGNSPQATYYITIESDRATARHA